MADDLRWALIDTLRLINSIALSPDQHTEAERIAGTLGIDIVASRPVIEPARPVLKLKAAR